MDLSTTSERPARRRVVITGMGALSPVGNTAPETWASLVAGRSGAAVIESFDTSPFQAKIGAEIKGFDPTQYIDAKEAKRMARCSQIAIVAAREAVADAGLDFNQEDRERVGVAMGTGMGGVDILVDPITKFATQRGARVTPHQALESLSHIAGFHVGLEHGCLGPLTTIITACAAGAQAIGEGLEWIRRGAADVVLAGGSEAQVNQLFFAGFGALRVLSTRNDEPTRATRPFDADRDGFVIGEAACVLVLEELERAKARGARIYAEVLGEAASADAYHIAQPEATGLGPARCMRWAMQDARVPPDAIQYINAHGTATPQNDPTETAAIKRVFGDHAYQIPISSTKSMTGHCFGGGSALEAFATVMTICSGVIHPTINLDRADPACDLDYVPNQARTGVVDVALTNSFGFGGQNACLVLGRYSS